MVKKTQTVQPLPEEIIEAVQALPEETVVAMTERQGKRINALIAHKTQGAAVLTEHVQNKVQLIQKTENALADVLSLAGDRDQSEEHERKLAEASGRAAFLLYSGLTTGIFSRDETSDLLGRTFGWKTKQNGEQSKTPFGQGETIRKRVIRAADAFSYVNSNAEPKAFFEPLDRSEVRSMLNEMEGGSLSIWQFYKDLSEMKADVSGTRPKPAFDPKRVLAIAGALSENIANSVEAFHNTPGLFAAYRGLFQTISTIGEEYSVAYPEEIAA